jgi:hypothetical protein
VGRCVNEPEIIDPIADMRVGIVIDTRITLSVEFHRIDPSGESSGTVRDAGTVTPIDRRPRPYRIRWQILRRETRCGRRVARRDVTVRAGPTDCDRANTAEHDHRYTGGNTTSDPAPHESSQSATNAHLCKGVTQRVDTMLRETVPAKTERLTPRDRSGRGSSARHAESSGKASV